MQMAGTLVNRLSGEDPRCGREIIVRFASWFRPRTLCLHIAVGKYIG